MNYYDSHGWLTHNEIPGRSGSDEAPAHGDAPAIGQPWPNWTGTAWTMQLYTTPVAPPAPSRGTIITPLAFLDRFGSALVGLYQAAMVNPQIQIYRDKVLMSKAIDLSHPVTIASVDALVPNLLTQDQANAILNNPVTESEL